jgi:hypothetical protein
MNEFDLKLIAIITGAVAGGILGAIFISTLLLWLLQKILRDWFGDGGW